MSHLLFYVWVPKVDFTENKRIVTRLVSMVKEEKGFISLCPIASLMWGIISNVLQHSGITMFDNN